MSSVLTTSGENLSKLQITVAQAMTALDDHQLNQSKPSEMEPKAVAQGMATLKQEQQLWRPGVKAEQVFINDFPFRIDCISLLVKIVFLIPNFSSIQESSWYKQVLR